jgi:hypothetical protein
MYWDNSGLYQDHLSNALSNYQLYKQKVVLAEVSIAALGIPDKTKFSIALSAKARA